MSNIQAEVEKLQKEIVNLQLRLKTQKRGGSEPASDIEAIKKAITRWAKFFSIFYYLGVTTDDFIDEKPNFNHDDPSHYEDDNAPLRTAAELYGIIPVNYMAHMIKYDIIAMKASNFKSITQFHIVCFH